MNSENIRRRREPTEVQGAVHVRAEGSEVLMETIEDILAEARSINPHNEWSDRIEAAHQAALIEKAGADSRAWGPLVDAAEMREAAAVAMYEQLKAAVRVYLDETAPLFGASAERVIRAREAVEEAMKGGNQ